MVQKFVKYLEINELLFNFKYCLMTLIKTTPELPIILQNDYFYPNNLLLE